MKRNIFLLTTVLLLTGMLTACNSNSKPECWKAKHNTINKDCNSGNGGFSMKTPGTDGNKRSAKAPKSSEGDTNPNVPAEDNSPPSDTAGEPNVPDQETDVSPPLQSNSNDVRGFDPFTAGLYGPGT